MKVYLMFKRKAIALAVLLLVATFSITNVTSVSAQSGSVGGNALRISPVRTDLEIKPGESKVISVFVQNVTKEDADLKGLVNDFGAGEDETGTPKIYLDENSFAPSHGLKRYITPLGNISLKPGESKEVKVTITIPDKAAGGGYFGAVRFVPVSKSTNQQLSLSASVGSLLLVTVPGDVREQLSISSININKDGGKASTFFTNGKNLQSVIRFNNSGNVQTYPYGKIIIKKSGKVVSSQEFNSKTPKAAILPDSTRKFSVALDGDTQAFGKYTMVSNFGYGSKGQLLTASTTFYIVPLPMLIAGIIILLLLVGAIVIFPRMLKSHDRKLLRKIRKGRK